MKYINRVIQYSDKRYSEILRNKSENIKKNSPDVHKLVKDLMTLAKKTEKDGVTTVGLSAPQIGANYRVFVFYDLDQKKYYEVINPEVIYESSELSSEWEGCASIGTGKNTLFGIVERPKKSKIKYFDLNGKEQVYMAEDYQSHVVLHEVDHLNGILFIDRVKDKNALLNSVELDKYLKKYGSA